ADLQSAPVGHLGNLPTAAYFNEGGRFCQTSLVCQRAEQVGSALIWWVGTSRCDVPARVQRAEQRISRRFFAPPNAARTAQRTVATKSGNYRPVGRGKICWSGWSERPREPARQ